MEYDHAVIRPRPERTSRRPPAAWLRTAMFDAAAGR
jgi:hypothetical protein